MSIDRRIDKEVVCSFAKLYPILCNPRDYSTPYFPVFHYLLEFAQILVHGVRCVCIYIYTHTHTHIYTHTHTHTHTHLAIKKE